MRRLGAIWLTCSALLSAFACIYVTYRVFSIDGTALPWLLPFAYGAILVIGSLLSIPGLIFLLIATTKAARPLNVATDEPTLNEVIRGQKKQA